MTHSEALEKELALSFFIQSYSVLIQIKTRTHILLVSII